MRHHANFYTNRLVTEWLKNGKIIIACDLDDTIIPYNDDIKDNCQIMVDLILECQKEGIIFLINTARSEYQLQKAKEQVEELGIVVHGINQMHEGWDKPYGLNGKLYANIFPGNFACIACANSLARPKSGFPVSIQIKSA